MALSFTFALCATFAISGAFGDIIQQFQSSNYPDRYIRHSLFALFLHPDDGSALFAADSRFKKVAALNGKAGYYSFESTNYAGHYIRHFLFRARIDPNDNSDLFKEDASWKEISALNGESGQVSYESANYPDRVLRHRLFEIWLDTKALSDQLFLDDSSWSILTDEEPHEYQVVQTSGLTFQKAQTYCQDTYGTNLATIWNDLDAEYLLDLAQNTIGGDAWIGLNDRITEGGWLYRSRKFDCFAEYGDGGCDADYPYWDDGEPSNAYATEDCAHIRAEATDIGEMLNDEACTFKGTSGFFCDKASSYSAAANAPFVDYFPSLGDYASGNYSSLSLYVASLLVLLLAVNLVLMCYVNCWRGRDKSRRAYRVVKFEDSDVEQSEAQAIKV